MNELEIHDAAFAITDLEARRKYLDEACGGDRALRSKVEAMLALGESSIEIPGPIMPEAGGAGAVQIDPLLGQSIGGVKLVRVISEGGMGRVYEGRQENPRGAVAVKLVKPGVATERLLRRFEFEAQVLARLSHPGVAQIFAAARMVWVLPRSPTS